MNTKEKSKSPMVDQLNEAHFALEIATNALYDLSALFRVIRGNTSEHSEDHRLAGIGTYLADTWGNDMDLVREDIDNFLKERGA